MTQTAGNYTLKIATISDIHLGHDRVPTSHIISNLIQAFPDTKDTHALDIIFIAGDLFDQILNLPELQVRDIKVWMVSLLTICKKANITLRILEGTPSHDRGQSRLFETINQLSGINADCRYIDTVYIEYLDKFDINVLYVPDEWKHDPDDTWNDVKDKLLEHKLDKVDYAVMHGVFEHQLPVHLKLPCHQSSRYLSIVKKYITIGHHHVMTVNDRILAQGSFDRLAHGEEGAKGHFRLTITDRDVCDHDVITFVENPNATIFKTIDVRGMSADDLDEVFTSVCKLPIESHIRLKVSKNYPHMAILDSYKKRFGEYRWVIKTEDNTTDVTASITFKNKHVAVEIKPDDIVNIVSSRLRSRGCDDAILNRAIELMEALK
jgi:hypothetical protein